MTITSKRFTVNMVKLKEQLAEKAFGPDPGPDKCRGCGKAPGSFTDKVSRREWDITRLCQACQDAVFVEAEDA
jgi:hypothetical protein